MHSISEWVLVNTILATFCTLASFHNKMMGEGTRTDFFFRAYFDTIPQLNKMTSLDDSSI